MLLSPPRDCIFSTKENEEERSGRKMKLTSKEWKSLMSLCLGGKPSIPFCIFPKVRSASHSPGSAPVYLNVYDLTLMNGYMYWVGLGVFHTGIEVHGVEYAFGAHDYPTSGVFEVEPHQCPGFKFRKSILMGTTCLDPRQVREFVEVQSVNYNGDSYHLIVKNCNHFCEDIIYKLTGNSIPKWVNRLARIDISGHRNKVNRYLSKRGAEGFIRAKRAYAP
ncbi:deSI-like protein At4g17486 isoform X3 [Musa acuminata AAA Group]|uniref:deSI-like protein At4g17486 isoform X3 n=1 Tax=Musa acuminata AAA Group TaxID=214697 RepID=UPI0031DFD906